MRRLPLAAMVVAALASSHSGSGLRAAGFGQTPALEFEVASIKRNTSGDLANPLRSLPNGQISWTNTPIQSVISRTFATDTQLFELRGLPGWAASERYDVVVKARADATSDELQQMWRQFLENRLRLATHFETEQRDSYDLVFLRQDKRLGPGIKPSSLDCSAASPQGPPTPTGGGIDAARAAALKRCNSFWTDADAITAGGASINSLARMLLSAAGRPIVDKTRLEGSFEIALRYQRRPASANADPDLAALPSMFTAVQEQLGFKLEPSKTQAQVLIIDHIERPTEN